jgi:pimeloyl-ACP methyl ester carboxylesterase
MATFALIHGAGDVGWYWHLVENELRQRGHATVAPDLPCEDDSAGLREYAGVVAEAVGQAEDVVVIAQSFAGFTAPLVTERLPVRALVLVSGMIPAPGERAVDWVANTGFDQVTGGEGDVFYHDVPEQLAREARARGRDQSATPGEKPWPMPAWPDLPTTFVLCTEDRFFPPAFMRRVVAERLGIEPVELAAGHCAALSQPVALAEILAASASAGRAAP